MLGQWQDGDQRAQVWYYFHHRSVTLNFIYLKVLFKRLTNDISWSRWLSFFSSFTIYISDATRKRAFTLVANAFSSINADDFAAYVGLPVNDAVKGGKPNPFEFSNRITFPVPCLFFRVLYCIALYNVR